MEKNVDESRAQEDDASTPRPGETLAMFYARSSSCSHHGARMATDVTT
jgi:hypothetical protein